MKVFYSIALLGVSLLTLTATAQRPNDWQKMNLKGKPALIVEIHIDASKEKFGEPIYDTLHIHTTYFDTTGKITKTIHAGKWALYHPVYYDSPKYQYTRLTYEYDLNNLLVHTRDERGDLRNTYEYELDSQGLILSKTCLFKSSIQWMMKYKYDQQGRTIQEMSYDYEGRLTGIADVLSFTANDLPHQVKLRSTTYNDNYGGAHKEEKTYTYHYDPYGNEVSLSYTTSSGQSRSTPQTQYQYDDHHNIIRWHTLPDNKKYTIRRIEYYK